MEKKDNVVEKLDTFEVNLPFWSGPLDLLLDLVKTSKVDIHDISIAEITKDYLAVIQSLKCMNVDLSSDFLVMASLLVLIKTRELLPQDERMSENGEENEKIIDSKALIEQLFHYEQFRRAAQVLSEKGKEDVELLEVRDKGEQREILPYLEEEGTFKPIGIASLMQSFVKVVEARKWDEEVHLHVKQKEQISVAQKMVEIKSKLSLKKRLSLKELLHKDIEKSDRFLLLGYFFAILELYRKREVTAWQKELFGDIFLKKAEL